MGDPVGPTVGFLLGQFSDALTAVVNDAFGGTWAENDEIIVLTELIQQTNPTVRDLASAASMPRHVLKYLVERLTHDGLVATDRSPVDRRVVTAALTDLGQARATMLRRAFASVLDDARPLAQSVVDMLDPAASEDRADPPAVVTDPIPLLGLAARTGQHLVGSIQKRGLPRISGRQRAALLQVARSPWVRPSDIGAMQATSRQNAAYVVDQLVDAGLVVRRSGAIPTDRRAVILEVTPLGEEVIGAVERAAEDSREELHTLFTAIRDWSSPAALP